MKNRLISLLIIVSFFISEQVIAQQFIPRYKPGIGLVKGYVIMNDGKRVNCSYNSFGPASAVTKLVIKDSKGKKIKLSANDIKAMYIQTSKLNRYGIDGHKYYVWKKVKNKKGINKLFQLVNPGFDSKLAIYIDPSGASKGGVSIGSVTLTSKGENSYYYTNKSNSKEGIVRKGSYKKLFPTIFDGCKKMLAQGKSKWKEFSTQVLLYEKCK